MPSHEVDMLQPELLAAWEKYGIQMGFLKRLKDDVVVWCSGSAARGIGRTRDEIMGHASFVSYPEAAEFHADDLEVYKSGKSRLFYLESYTASDGTVHQLVTNKFPLDIDGEAYVGLCAVDLTDLIGMLSTEETGRAHRVETVQVTRAAHKRLIQALYPDE